MFLDEDMAGTDYVYGNPNNPIPNKYLLGNDEDIVKNELINKAKSIYESFIFLKKSTKFYNEAKK